MASVGCCFGATTPASFSNWARVTMAWQPAWSAAAGFFASGGMAAFEFDEPAVWDGPPGFAEERWLLQRPSILITGASGATLEPGVDGAVLSLAWGFVIGPVCAGADGRTRTSDVNSMKISHR